MSVWTIIEILNIMEIYLLWCVKREYGRAEKFDIRRIEHTHNFRWKAHHAQMTRGLLSSSSSGSDYTRSNIFSCWLILDLAVSNRFRFA